MRENGRGKGERRMRRRWRRGGEGREGGEVEKTKDYTVNKCQT